MHPLSMAAVKLSSGSTGLSPVRAALVKTTLTPSVCKNVFFFLSSGYLLCASQHSPQVYKAGYDRLVRIRQDVSDLRRGTSSSRHPCRLHSLSLFAPPSITTGTAAPSPAHTQCVNVGLDFGLL